MRRWWHNMFCNGRTTIDGPAMRDVETDEGFVEELCTVCNRVLGERSIDYVGEIYL